MDCRFLWPEQLERPVRSAVVVSVFLTTAVPSSGNCNTGFADSMGLQIILCSHGFVEYRITLEDQMHTVLNGLLI